MSVKEILINKNTGKEISNDFHYGNIDSDFSCNSLYFTRNNNPAMLISGELHFSRVNCANWKKELLKMKECGLDFVSTYIFWNHHERVKDEFDFKGNRDIRRFLALCKEISLPCILRIGPWAHGEARYGGFPDYIHRYLRKRQSARPYMERVKIFWTKLYEQCAEYCDGNTVAAIQLENEYFGLAKHIFDLRELAVNIGFKAPFFTMTAWPVGIPSKSILGLFGGYPEAPWAGHKRPLKPADRFKICSERSESEIGEDLIKRKKRKKVSFEDIPYGGCEVGVGNEVTQMRRPVIDDIDGYGVAFAKIASGMKLIGYYMFHGGRNPLGGLYQESRRSCYPNNYPVVDYDFQAPLSKDGDLRKHGDKLRCIHMFLHTYEKTFASCRAFFPSDENYGKLTGDIPYLSVIMDENDAGYLFVSNYERGVKNISQKNITVKIDDRIMLPELKVEKNAMFYMPFNQHYAGVKVDFISGEPITHITRNNYTTYYFRKIYDITAIYIDGEKTEFEKEYELSNGEGKIVMLDNGEAYSLHKSDDEIVFTNGNMWQDDNNIYCDLRENEYISIRGKQIVCTDKANNNGISLYDGNYTDLCCNHYLYSYGKRRFYGLKLNYDVLKRNDDVEIVMNFSGLNLQLYDGKKLIDDYFNTNGKYVLKLSYLRDIMASDTLTIVTVPPTKHGVGKVYNEIGLKAGENELTIERITAVKNFVIPKIKKI